MKFTAREFPSFLLVAALNSGLTYLIYLAFLQITNFQASYTIAFTSGIGISYLLNSILVFRRPLRLSSALAYPLTYVVQYVAGMVLLTMIVKGVGVPVELAPLLVVVLTSPISFILSKRIIQGPNSTPNQEESK